MRHTSRLKILLFLMWVVVASCSREEPFDVIGAQRQLSGKWDCTEDTGKSYQITIVPYGMVNIYIKNICNMGEDVAVNVNLLDENSLLIPSQHPEGYRIEGTGTISEGYKKMILELRFDDGTKSLTSIVVTCNKQPQ